MIFSSLIFLYLFLPIVLLGLGLCRKTAYQNTFLFIASIIFYSWGGVSYTAILLLSIIVNYVFGLLISSHEKHKTFYLVIAIILNLSALAFFKYANFLVDNINILTSVFKVDPIKLHKIVLPIGISFYTFQGISYIVDVYRKTVAPQRNFIKLGTYIALFPQLIAGPIIRYFEISKQLDKRDVTIDNIFQGIKRFVFGLARKVIIANSLAVVADDIFSRPPDTLTCATAWIGAICYSLQIYYDFAGYSDMAIGLGRMFGFTFPENFNFPYISRSIKEFWRRWHITLSAWFKDYLYIPLGGNRRGKARLYLNLYIVFFCTGLWHGASWNFVIWGLLHGSFLVLERVGFNKILNKTFRPIQHLYTLLVVIIAWVFFRADTLPYATDYIARMFSFSNHGLSNVFVFKHLNITNIIILMLAVLGSFPLFAKCKDIVSKNKTLAFICTIIFIIIVMFLVTTILVAGGYNPFIYYRF
ncbi:MAG: MBOAT family protein [Bacteroidales bacterium]|jgi:alginate O-acetyltransferase complex protein AlgI|nr:hypothetical protein [Bacteroidales bacterium]MDD2205488.1 MBOAT family protein [Bacteroidales bacterium]MDD3151560.1 MBOAT family protein [Bacteroidales bacterium]MDD3914925.1 MBOAT family protein [Bacteroidales bacterium]MDD4634777.1 MBOAT family protein [Bacteroidales bacterium]